MKRLVLILLLLGGMLSSHIMKAQDMEPFQKKFLIGLSGGTTYNRYIFTPSVSQHTLNGYWAGLIFRYDVESYASLQFELNYSRSGWRERYSLDKGGEDPNTAYKREMDYVRMPILSNLHFNYGRWRVFVNAGPEFGWQIKETSTELGRDNLNSWDKERHDLATKNKFSWGLTGGVGVGVRLGEKHRIEIEGRYTYGFGDIWSTKRIDPYGKASETIIGARINYLFIL